MTGQLGALVGKTLHQFTCKKIRWCVTRVHLFIVQLTKITCSPIRPLHDGLLHRLRSWFHCLGSTQNERLFRECVRQVIRWWRHSINISDSPWLWSVQQGLLMCSASQNVFCCQWTWMFSCKNFLPLKFRFRINRSVLFSLRMQHWTFGVREKEAGCILVLKILLNAPLTVLDLCTRYVRFSWCWRFVYIIIIIIIARSSFIAFAAFVNKELVPGVKIKMQYRYFSCDWLCAACDYFFQCWRFVIVILDANAPMHTREL